MANWQNKIVLITGGSSGLGLHLARAWATAGATVLLVARNEDKLAAATQRLTADNLRAHFRSTDITNDADVAALRDWVSTEFGCLDVLVNMAGKSDRGRVSETAIETFDELWQLNFLATVRCAQTFLPLLKESSGSLVNIGSLAAKTAAPFIGAYPSSKFPVAAFSQQLRLELAEDHQLGQPAPPHVLLVCPGPIARDDAGERYSQQAGDLPASASKPGGGARVRAIDPADLSQKIIAACESRKIELVVPGKSRLLFAIQSLFPAWGDALLRRMTKSKE